MEQWVHRALAKWPNVPHLYGWLSLDRRGRWRIRGELITRPQIIDTINANYAADERGCWYFQNGPQRGYMALDYTPLILHAFDGQLRTHNGLAVTTIHAAYLDDEGALLLNTEHGAGLLDDNSLGWALEHLRESGESLSDTALESAIAVPHGHATALHFHWNGAHPLQRLDRARAPVTLGFVRDPQP